MCNELWAYCLSSSAFQSDHAAAGASDSCFWQPHNDKTTRKHRYLSWSLLLSDTWASMSRPINFIMWFFFSSRLFLWYQAKVLQIWCTTLRNMGERLIISTKCCMSKNPSLQPYKLPLLFDFGGFKTGYIDDDHLTMLIP